MPRWIDRLRLRVRSLVNAHAEDDALRREIAQHLEEQIAENLAAGMSPPDARAAALRAFGSVARTEEECRDTRGVAVVANLLQDLRYTARSLWRQPLLVTAATLSIAVAVGANTTIYSLANELLLAAPAAQRPDGLARIRMSNGSHVSYRQWRQLEQSGALQGLAGYQIEVEVNWRGPRESLSLLPLIVTANFFDVLGVPIAMGRGFTAAEADAERDPAVAVISHGFWRTRLAGDPSIVGKTLVFNGRPFTVLGVLPKGARSVTGYGVAPEVYLPLSPLLMSDMYGPHAATVQLIGRLREGQTASQGRAALDTAARNIALHDKNAAPSVSEFVPIGTLAGTGDISGVGAFLAVLLAGVGLVLAIACANVASLLLARSTVRRRELAVRVALGASRRRLLQQLLTEGFWLALLGTAAGLLLMFALVPLIGRVSLPVPVPIEINPSIDARLLVYSLLLLVVTTGLCAVAPALQATRPSLVPSLKQEDPRHNSTRWTLRSMLVTGQVAVALVLLTTATLFIRNLSLARNADPGFDAAHTLVAEVSFVEGRYTRETRDDFLVEAAGRLGALPGIEHVSYASGVPLTLRSGSTTGTGLRIVERGEAFHAVYQANVVAPDYFATMGIRLLSGREFRSTDRRGAPAVVVINEEFARRYFGGSNPVGQHLLLPGPDHGSYPAQVVGVAANSRYRTIGEDQQPALYEAFLQRATRLRFVHILVRTKDDPATSIPPVQRVLGGMDPSAAVTVKTMGSALAFAFMPSRIGAALLGGLGGLGLALAMVGLYAMMSYAVSRRTAEIGIRLALGAPRAAVLRLVLRDAAILTGTGTILGLAAAVFVTRPLAMFLVSGLSASDPMTFAGTGALLAAVSLFASWGPARRALRIDPAAALRDE